MTTQPAKFDVVCLGASAGGQPAILSILRDLPLDFDIPIVIVQHLPVTTTILDVYAARLPFTFEWIDEHSRLTPRKVLLCPPRACVELLPNGGFRLDACERGALDKQIDRLLHSVARSFSHRAIGLILTGMGDDGAVGANALHAAGGRVLVQTESSADFADMPRAALAAGAADLVVPLGDMARVLIDLVAGAVRPKARSELDAIDRVFGQHGAVAAQAREIDWSKTSLGVALEWPIEFRFIARTVMESRHPSALWWGRDLVQTYNEAYRRFLGPTKHSQALGRPARETWGEIWGELGPIVQRVMEQGVAVNEEEFRFVIDRHGVEEEIFVNFAYTPVRNAQGAVLGVYNTCWESTRKVVAERRMAALRAIAAQVIGAGTPRHACERAATALGTDRLDMPFALLYLFDPGRRNASLAGAAGLVPGSAAAPQTIGMVAARDLWALQRLLEGDATEDAPGVLLEDLTHRVPNLGSLIPGLEDRLVPRSALVLPLRWAKDKPPVGAMIAGIGPQRPFDDDYRAFLRLVGQQISAGLAEARTRELERERADRLAELDRAKTEFFANVSHEFRTPLTLLLFPLEEMRRRRDELPSELATEIDVAARNSRRLLRLVDSLLDFAQIEGRWQRVVTRPTDLAALTSDVASAFRSAIERAGLALCVDCDVDMPLVSVERDMWEKVVSNLLSNALKFTFEGCIGVRLKAMSLHVELVVSDTGIGVPKHELPNLFKRFHRVRGARARTIEGSGIGLALVHDLVGRMGGQVHVQSVEGSGTSFTVWLPLKVSGQAFDAAATETPVGGTAGIAAGLAEEADAWLAERPASGMLDELLQSPKGEQLQIARGARVLVADDNADLRDYLQRLLGAYWHVTVVADGAAALAAARRSPPDLLLADVMMPNLDGFALLRAVRDDPALKHIPVIFLTARAAEDTAIEGIVAGADDYLAKPFSARELVARVGGQIMLSRARRRTQEINAFLVRFSDAVRGLSDGREIGETACRMLYAQLGVQRVYWAEFDAATNEYVVSGGMQSPEVVAIEGRFPLGTWDVFAAADREQWSHVVDDSQTDSRIPDTMKAGYAAIGVGANIASPVFVDGSLRCVISVNQRQPRHWTADEIALVEGVAGRCWAEVERARAEAGLRASEARMRAVLEQAPMAVAFTGPSGEVLFRNAMYDTLWGRPDLSANVRTDSDVHTGYHLDGQPVASGEWPGARALLTGEVVAGDVYEVVQSDGTRIDCWMASAPVRDGEGAITGGVVLLRDVTEERRAQQALRHSEDRYRMLFEASPMPFVVTAPDSPRFTIIGVNDAYLGATARTREAMVGRPLFEEFPDDPTRGISSVLRASFERVIATRRQDVMPVMKYDIAGADGTFDERWWIPYQSPVLDDDGQVRAIIHSATDITDIHRAEDAVRESEARLAATFEALPLGVGLTDATGKLVLSNKEMQRFLAAGSLPSLDGRDERWMAPDADRRRLERHHSAAHLTTAQTYGDDYVAYHLDGRQIAPEEWPGARAVHKGEVVQDELYEFVQADGRRTTCWVSAAPIRDLDGRIEGGVVLFGGVTEDRRMQEALRHSEEKYRALFTQMDEAYAVVEAIADETGRWVDFRFLEVNAPFMRHTGMPYPVGRTATELLGTPNPRWAELYGRAADTGESIRVEEGELMLGRVFDLNIFRLGGEGSRRVAVLFTDITERRRAEVAVRESEAQQRYLVRLGDALQTLTDAAAIQAEAARVLGEQIGCDRVSCIEIDEARGQCVVEGEWRRDDGASRERRRRHPLSAWPMPRLAGGKPWVVRDVPADAGLSDAQRAAFRDSDIGACTVVPVLKGGRVAAMLVSLQTAPRDWTTAEIELQTETAARTWSAVERARAAAALRASEQRRLIVLDVAGIGDWAYDVASGVLDCSPRACAMHGVEPGQPVSVELHDRLIHPDDLAGVQAARARALDPAGAGEYRIEFRFHLAGGGTRCMESVGRAVFEDSAEGPRAVQIIGAMIDVTGRRIAWTESIDR